MPLHLEIAVYIRLVLEIYRWAPLKRGLTLARDGARHFNFLDQNIAGNE